MCVCVCVCVCVRMFASVVCCRWEGRCGSMEHPSVEVAAVSSSRLSSPNALRQTDTIYM